MRLFGGPGLLASTGLAANRWRTAALATPIVLIAMLIGIQGLLQTSEQRHTEQVTAARVTADHVVAISNVVATEGHLRLGDAIRARMADTQPATLQVAAIYDRAAGLGHVVMDRAIAQRHAGVRTSAVFVAGGAPAGASLAGAAVLGLAAGAVSARLALRTSPAAAMRTQE